MMQGSPPNSAVVPGFHFHVEPSLFWPNQASGPSPKPYVPIFRYFEKWPSLPYRCCCAAADEPIIRMKRLDFEAQDIVGKAIGSVGCTSKPFFPRRLQDSNPLRTYLNCRCRVTWSLFRLVLRI